MNVSEIISPLGPGLPCGEDIRVSPQFKELYFTIKDARNSARSAERSIAPGEPVRLTQSWHEVNDLGLQILVSQSKDIEILAWLAEAQLRLRGFEGLKDVFAATASLLDNYWDELHSIGHDDVAEKLAPLAGLNGISGEGALIPAIRLSPLVPNVPFGQHTLWDYQLAQRANETGRRNALYEAASEAGVAAMSAHLGILNECMAAFDNLVSVLDRRCGDTAPPSSNTRNVLAEAASAIRVLGGITVDVPVDAVQEEHIADGNGSAALAAAPISARAVAIGTREEAFEVLLSVARYFRVTEPHSPISMSIETLVRRGRMDFSELLTELLPEPQVRMAVMTAAGIQPDVENKGN
ncbi:type VI secretion system protein TssA [Phyllobacterium sp. 21LDTY02-6]|uniref:type VI secretion system protein TssA n=1 Tax=unclassified Phyllobacterium TaxID=2638441 RepID=UPI00201FFB7B|nr:MULTISPECIES: type VI secretion system protein TssA [unclassified Phyllobacterium]MCO4318072.1 type VI secretion system protein TssA [Phyllobacterium sp. 21LDTY02-6]MCX8280066.1 type VI secretion system protein TssA [Phyllobacterium sp. 0TCS1.6C]MCX8294372.1 type VI secretion system protein TssA [Phyllobacterium sp. 0TCS1.6A]